MINKQKQKQIEEVYTSIRNDWTVDHYSTCTSAWAKIKSFISKEPTPYQCGDCKTYWTKVTYVNDHYNVCPNCDTYWEPFLCNPVNWISVLEHIDPKYHQYVIPKHNDINPIPFLQHIKDDITGTISLIGDDFTFFLEGLTMKTIDFEYIGFYECETKDAYIYVKNRESKIHNIIYNAWQLFCTNDEINIKIYVSSQGFFYEENGFETDKKYFIKYVMNILGDKLVDD